MSSVATIDRVAREATGRLVALLARRSGDLALAEDAMSTALVAALEQWPRDGVPRDPEGWLYTVARRALVGHWRRAEVRQRKSAALKQFQALQAEMRPQEEGWPDERLPLLFVCAHPAIAPAIRAPLMLQSILGMTAEELGPLMGVSPGTIGQRLWRAKVKIKAAAIPFVVPARAQLPGRLDAVLDAIYGLYGVGWGQRGRAAFAQEALWLSEVVCGLLPDAPEALGLRALLLFSESRRAAGRDARGAYVPLDAQDPGRWDAVQIALANATLRRARGAGVLGPFQLEAAIQSALVHGRRQGAVDHAAIVALYDGLVQLAPTLGIRVGRAAAMAEHQGGAVGLAALEAIEGAGRFQPWWAVRADLLRRMGQIEAAKDAYDRAISLSADPAVRTFLEGRRDQGEAEDR
ncbi:MAG: DUF6596 domain-containing protein [Myxococcota bacterium]